MADYILYGSEMSYFSGKARYYLRWKRVPFEERPTDAAFFEQICVPRIGYPMIPLLITPDDVAIQDTTLIMDHFEAMDAFGPSLTAEGPVQRFVADLIELYADDWLLIPAMHYRWGYDAETTLLEFGMNWAPDASLEEQRKIGEERGAFFRGAVPVLGVHEHNKDAVEQSWRDLLAELDTHFRAHAYLLGDRPCTGDFSLIGALYAHLYRDATAGALMRREALAVARYVERMMTPRSGGRGAYLSHDQIPETLLPVLRRMMAEQAPVLADTALRLAQWKRENPDKAIPRFIGFHSFSLQGLSAERAIIPYATWLHQRAKAAYDATSGSTRERADALLDACDGGVFRTARIEAPVKLEDYILQWA